MALTFTKKLSALVLAEAAAVNYYGKRLRDKKLLAAETIISTLTLKSEPAALVLWLDANKPEKPQAEGKPKAAAKPAASTVLEGYENTPDLPLLFEASNAVIITAAQNNTAVNAEAWEAITTFAEEMQAQIAVMPIYYNKNSFSPSVESEDEYFAEQVRPFMVLNDSAAIDNGLITLRASAAILPTAKKPCNSAEVLNKGELVTVVGATKQQFKTLVRSPSMPIREAWATGCVTNKNYIRGRAGAEAESEHVYGALLIVNCDGVLYPFNLVYKNGALLHSDTVAPDEAVAVLGDLHCERKDPAIWAKTLDWLEQLQPKLIAVHDILHFETANHHNRNNGKHLYKVKDRAVLDDLATVIDDLNTLASIAPVYVVESNHNSALDNWLHDIGYNPKRDPRQAKLYYLLNYLVCEALDDPEQDGNIALKVAFENLQRFDVLPELSERVRFGSMSISEIHYGYDLSQHGHKGANGASGSTVGFARWGFPMVTGHTHSPALLGNVLTVGVTASLNQGYNAGGGSSWNQSHGVVLPNGVAQIVPMRGLYL